MALRVFGALAIWKVMGASCNGPETFHAYGIHRS